MSVKHLIFDATLMFNSDENDNTNNDQDDSEDN